MRAKVKAFQNQWMVLIGLEMGQFIWISILPIITPEHIAKNRSYLPPIELFVTAFLIALFHLWISIRTGFVANYSGHAKIKSTLYGIGTLIVPLLGFTIFPAKVLADANKKLIQNEENPLIISRQNWKPIAIFLSIIFMIPTIAYPIYVSKKVQRQEMGELDKLLHHGLLMKGAVARLTSITKISGEVKTDYSGVQIEYLDPLGVKRSFLEEWPANYGNVKVGDAVDLFYVESNKKRKAASKYQLRGQSL